MEQVDRGAHERPPHGATDGHDAGIRTVLVEGATGELGNKSKAGANTCANEDAIENGIVLPLPNDHDIVLAEATFTITGLDGQRRSIQLRDTTLRFGACRVDHDDAITWRDEELQVPERGGNALGGRKRRLPGEEQRNGGKTGESSHDLLHAATIRPRRVMSREGTLKNCQPTLKV